MQIIHLFEAFKKEIADGVHLADKFAGLVVKEGESRRDKVET